MSPILDAQEIKSIAGIIVHFLLHKQNSGLWINKWYDKITNLSSAFNTHNYKLHVILLYASQTDKYAIKVPTQAVWLSYSQTSTIVNTVSLLPVHMCA